MSIPLRIGLVAALLLYLAAWVWVFDLMLRVVLR